MLFRHVLTGFLLAAGFFPVSGMAEQVDCTDPIDNEARLGFPPGASVAVSEDPDNKICRFSINGYDAGSPDQDALFAARQRVLDVLRPEFFKGGGDRPSLSEEIGLLIAAASPFDSPDPKFLYELYDQVIQGCFLTYPMMDGRAFLPYEDPDLVPGDFWCGVIVPGADADALELLNAYFSEGVDSGLRVVELTVPNIVFRNDREGIREFLLLPLPRLSR